MRELEVDRFDTGGGRRVFRLPLRVFPGFVGNAYLVCGGQRPLLVDCGSGQETSNHDLAGGFERVRERFDETVALADVGAVVLTHGHIDHFGGVRFVRRHTPAPIAIQVLDRRVLSSWEDRVIVISKRIDRFLEGAGIGAPRRADYMRLYLSTRQLFESLPVDLTFEEGALMDGELEAIHVPGHCPGQVCLRVDDVLLTADHVLEKISPHVSPEAITRSNGIGHYLESLAKTSHLEGVRLGLGGHQGEIRDVAARCDEIRRLTEDRLQQVLELCAEPRRVAEVSREVFGRVRSYHVLLALLESGALVEYLHQRGDLQAANLEDVESGRDPVILYRRVG